MSTANLQSSHPGFATGKEPTWLAGVRAAALADFDSTGIPNRRVEEWRYSNPKHIAGVDWTLAAEGAHKVDGLRIDHAIAELVFVNGRFDAAQSRGVQAGQLSHLGEAIASGSAKALLARFTHEPKEAFSALNLAFLQDGAWIVLDKNVALDGLIHILHLVDDGAEASAQIRNVIVLGEHASARVVESYAGLSDGTLTNALTEVQLGAGAELEHTLWQRGPTGSKIGRVHVHQGRDSAYDSHSFWMGGTWVRNDIHVELAEPGAACSLNGLYLLDKDQHLDNHTLMDHQAPHCVSRELYKGVLSGSSTGVYNGMVRVQKDAQKTDSEQANHNLLLSESADINTKPELEIYADDVKCAHGTTVGQLDAEALMYMRMRGISKTEAIHILTGAFVQELLGEVEDEALRALLAAVVKSRLSELREGAR
jgi:Fe-S cluster assembly protein SufD